VLSSYDVSIEPERSENGTIAGLTVSAFDIQPEIDLQRAKDETVSLNPSRDSGSMNTGREKTSMKWAFR
jgi:predicted NUDIX family NTP pyrophosphohydrolase